MTTTAETSLERSLRKRFDRIEEFKANGIEADAGQYLGNITLSATEAEKALKLIRKLRKAMIAYGEQSQELAAKLVDMENWKWRQP